ncbi:hypothetical protein C1280_15720 [Gemmata obscuriglobus]|uniref:Site-specific integrase n=2 Tax=Gemmata obscuriglobus TaxID=114 RepID=A0A2Z3HAT2_9BACT|nr:hypothetical protein C1280_15720 [Gemmata obscuriglobus]
MIDEEYRAALPPEPSKATWDAVLTDLDRTPDLRPDSVRAYRTAVKALRDIFPELAGPADVTVPLAEQFKRKFMSGTYARGKASDAKRYTRSKTSCATYLRCLRSLWQKHFKPLGHVDGNPSREVEYPNTPRGRRVTVPAEETVTAFFTWLAQRHPGWELPKLFVQVKIVAGRRTLDLCKVRTTDLGADTLTLSAETTKTREARVVPLPAQLATALKTHAGPVWLWERSAEESKLHRPDRKKHGVTEYKPTTWGWTIQNLFHEFNESRPGEQNLRPHDLRGRAFTLVAATTGDVYATAAALGADPQTARHYLEAAKAFDRSGILKQAAAILLPPHAQLLGEK